MAAQSTYEIVLKAVSQGFDKAKADLLSVWKDGTAKSAEQIDRLNSKVHSLESNAAGMQEKLSRIDAFRKLKGDSAALYKEWKSTEDKAAQLSRQIKTTDGSTKGLERSFKSSVTTAGKLKQKYAENEVALEQMRRELSSSGISTGNLSAAQKTLTADLSRTNSALSKTRSEFAAARQPTIGLFTKLKTATGSFTAEIQKNKKEVPAWSRVVKTALAGMGVKMMTQELYDAGMTAQNLSTSFTAIAKDAEKGADELAFVRKTSDELGLSFVGTAKSYTGIFAASQLTTMKGEKTREIFTSIAEAMTALRKPSENTESALLAIEQMMNKGVVQSQELKLQLGNALPGAFELAAKAAGMTTAEFMKQLNTGQVMADDLLPKLARVLHEQYGEAAREAAADSNNAQAAMNHWLNTWYDFKVAMSESGFLQAATQTLGQLTAELQDPATVKSLSETAGLIFKAVGYVVRLGIEWGKWIAIVGGGYLVVSKMWPVLKGINVAFTLMTGLPVSTWFSAYIQGAQIATVQSGLLQGSVSSLGVAITIAAGAVGAFFAGWQLGKIIGDIPVVKHAVQTTYAIIDKGISEIKIKYLELKKAWHQLWGDNEAAAAIQKQIDAEKTHIAAIDKTIEMINGRTDASKKSAKSMVDDSYHIAQSEGAAAAAVKKAAADAANAREKMLEKIAALQKKAHEDQMANINKEVAATKAAVEKQLAAIDLKASQGIITEDDAARQKLDIQKKSAENELATLKMYQKKELELYGEQNEKRKKLRDQLDKALVAAETKLTKIRAQEAARREADEKAAADKRLAMIDWELAQEIITEKQAAEKRKQVRIDELNTEIAALQAQWDREIEKYGQANEKRAGIRDRLQAKLLKAEAELTTLSKIESDKRTKNEQAASDKRVEIEKSAYEKAQEVIRSETKLKRSELDIQLTDLKNQLSQGRISYQQYIEQKTAAEEAFARYNLEQMKKQVEAAKKAYGEMSAEYVTAVNEMEAAQNKLIKTEKAGAEERRLAETTFLLSYISSFDRMRGKYEDLVAEIKKFREYSRMALTNPYQFYEDYSTLTTLIKIRDTIEEIGTYAKQRYNITLDVSGLSLSDAKKTVEDLDRAFADAAGKIADIGKKESDMAIGIRNWKKGIDDSAPSVADITQKMGDLRQKVSDLFSDKTFSPEAAKAALSDIISSYQDLESTGASVVDALKQQWDDLSGKIRSISDQIAQLESDTASTIRDMEEATMSDAAKWEDQRRRYYETYDRAVAEMRKKNTDAAIEAFKQAAQIAKGLAVEVKDASGNVISSLAQNTQTAITLVEKAAAASKNVLQKQQHSLVAQQQAVSGSIDETVSKMQQAATQMTEINNKMRKMTAEEKRDLTTPMIFGSGGPVFGPLHSSGGTVIEAEGGEYVQPRSAVQKYGTAFMEAIRAQRLILPKFSAGGLVNGAAARVSETFLSSLRAIALPKFADGGPVPAAAGSLPAAGMPSRTLRVEFSFPSGRTYSGVFPESGAMGLVRELEAEKKRAN